MSGTRIGPPPVAVPSTSTEAPPRRLEPIADLGEAMADLARLLVQDSEATRLAKAQVQIEALHYSAQLAVARGDLQALRGLSSEAGRISRDLAAGGMGSDQVSAIIAQANQVGQVCEGGDAGQTNLAAPSTDIVT